MVRRLVALTAAASLSLGGYAVGTAALSGPVAGTAMASPAQVQAGYWVVSANGHLSELGTAGIYGSQTATTVTGRVVAIAATPDGKGYWLASSGGKVFAYGDAPTLAPAGTVALAPAQAVVAIAATPDGKGYWLASSGGKVFAYGDAPTLAPAGTVALAPAQAVVAIAATPDGKGYWLASSGGKVFAYGDAPTLAPAGTVALAPAQAVVAIAATPDGKGYWLASSGGKVFAYGDAPTLAPAGTVALAPAQAVVAIAATPDGKGYWLASSGGKVFAYGDAPTLAPAGTVALAPAQAVVAIAANRSNAPVGQAGTPAYAAGAAANVGPLPIGTVQDATSPNWSGYVATDGPYTAVAGTFTIPTAQSSVPGATVCEWAGIDGYTNKSLVQAGVNELTTTSGQVDYQPWWEIYPTPQIPIAGVTVHIGDTVTVRIHQLTGHQWQIMVTDNTDAQTFTTVQSYTGPATSAEWVVEAEVPVGAQSPALAPYTPGVAFTDPGITSATTGTGGAGRPAISRVVMVQSGAAVSTPSLPGSQGDFTVAYGAQVPGATTPAARAL